MIPTTQHLLLASDQACTTTTYANQEVRAMISIPNTAMFRSALLLCSCIVVPTRCIHSVVGLPLGKGTSAGPGLSRNSQSGAHPSAACHSSSRSRGKPRPRTIAICSWYTQTPLEANEPPKKPGSWDLLIYWRAQNSSALIEHVSQCFTLFQLRNLQHTKTNSYTTPNSSDLCRNPQFSPQS